MRRDKGFTLVELLVVTIVFGIVAAILSAIFINSRRSKIVTELVTEAQQNARIAVDLMASEIRSAGYGVDWDLEQRPIVYAGPYDIIFNANINPYPDTDPPGAPAAIDTTKTPREVPPGGNLYVPITNYLTGAETIRFTFDYENDEDIDSSDRDNEWARKTRNPNDYLLVKQIYGYDSGENNNGGENQGIALLRGPDQWPNQTSDTPPLFEYWWDHDEDPDTPDSLWGDADRDGELSDDEMENLNDPVPNPERISRVGINGVGETKSITPGGTYQQVVVSTAVSVMRNPNPRRYTLTGHVYNDYDEDGQFDGTEEGLGNIKVSVSPGLYEFTESGTGLYEFSLVVGNYTVKAYEKIGWELTTPAETTVEISSHDVDLTEDRHFGMKSVPTAWIQGTVFYDSIPDHDGVYDSIAPGVERGISGVNVNIPTVADYEYTDENGYYIIQVNWQEDPHTVLETDSAGYVSSTPNTIYITLADSAGCMGCPCDSVDDLCTLTVDFGDVYFSAEETVLVRVPNGGEEYFIGADTCVVTWWASDASSYIDTAWIFLSRNAGASYDDSIHMVLNYDRDEPWVGTYAWPVEGPASDECKMKVMVWDSVGNYAEDESDEVFAIHRTNPLGVHYFRTDTSGVYTGSGDTVRLFMDEPGDSAAYAACTTSGIPGAPSILYYLCPNPTVYDTAAWVTDTFPDTTISAGTWWFFFWAKADTYYYDPLGEKLYHFMAVKVWRYRGTGPDSLLFLEIDDPSDVASHVKQYWDLFTVEANNIGSITFNAGDRLWIEVWTYRDATLNDPVEVRFGYNSPPDTLRSYFEMP